MRNQLYSKPQIPKGQNNYPDRQYSNKEINPLYKIRNNSQTRKFGN